MDGKRSARCELPPHPRPALAKPALRNSSFPLLRSGEWGAPPPKRSASAPTAALLQQERARQRRAQESVEQLRLELQMMARVLAAAREQIVALGGASLAPEPTLLAAPAGAVAAADGAAAAAAGAAAGAAAAAPVRQARSKGDARLLQRLQEELTESRGECKRLAEQVSTLQTKMKSMQGAKREILACCAEMSDYLATRREQ